MDKIGVIDYGCGNFTSVWNALCCLTSEDSLIRIENTNGFSDVSHIILPGVGAFKYAMDRIIDMGILNSIISWINSDSPFLGICVGMQVMAEWGNEFERCAGLGVIKSEVVKFDPKGGIFTVPHIGWNNLTCIPENTLFDGITEEADFYFVHSFYALADRNTEGTWGTASYADVDFGATYSYGNVHGVQFHPEKSQYYGLKLLSNFINL